MEHRNPVGREQLTVDNTAGGVSLTVPAGANRALMVLSTAQIRVTDDGTAPTTTVGIPVNAGERVEYLDGYYRSALLKFRAIRTGASSGVLDIAYYN